MNRYDRDMDLSRVICNDCSTRTTVVAIPADEIAAHDLWHNECEAFNAKREGMCKAQLLPDGSCPDALDHGDHLST